MIAQNYLQGRFIIEALGSYPAELVDMLGINTETGEGANGTEVAILRALRLLRLLRVVRVSRELQAIYSDVLLRMESRLQTNLAAFHLIGPIIILIYVMHLLACFFNMISCASLLACPPPPPTSLTTTLPPMCDPRVEPRVEHRQYALDDLGYENSWVLIYEDGVALKGSLRQRYLISLYWASGTATGLGTGVLPANELEWVFVSGAHCVGVVVMGSVIGWIARAIEASQSPIDKMIELKTDVVKDITRWRAMPPELADHVIRFYSHYSRKHAGAVMDHERALLEALAVAPSLRREVLRHLLGKSVQLIPMFSREVASYATDEFQLNVDTLLKPIVYAQTPWPTPLTPRPHPSPLTLTLTPHPHP